MVSCGGKQERSARLEPPSQPQPPPTKVSCEQAVNDLVHGFLEVMQSLPPALFDPERTRALICDENAAQLSCEAFGMTDEQCAAVNARLLRLAEVVADACHVVIPEDTRLPGPAPRQGPPPIP